MKYLVIAILCLQVACLTPKNQPPIFISGPGPIYPVEAKRNGIEGYVVVIYDVTIKGQVENLRIESAEPQGIFDEAALAAVSAWQFKPPRVNGVEERFFNVRSKVGFQIGETKYR